MEDETNLFAVLEDIAVQLKRTNEFPTWKKILTDNLFESCSCFKDITSEDWLAMNLPLNLLVELRRVLSKKKIVSRKDLANRHSKFPDLSILTKQVDERKSRGASNASANAKKKKISRKSVNTLDDKRALVQLVGAKELTSFLLHQLIGDSKTDLEPNIYKNEVLGNQITAEIHDFANSQLEYCSCMMLLFESNNFTSLGDLIDNCLSTTMRKKFQTPLLLVGIDVENKNMFEIIPAEMIKETIEQLGAIRYMQVTNSEESKELFNEASKIFLRSFSIDTKIESAIHKNFEKKSPDLILKNSSISILPSCFYQLSSHLQRVCLSGNLFKYFPTEVLSLRSLTDLDLSFNEIASIPNEISSLTNLLRFDIENNLLESLPLTSLKKLPMLKELKIKNNPLTKLPAIISKGKGDLITVIKEYSDEELNSHFAQKLFSVSLQSIMASEYLLSSNPLPRFLRLAINFVIKNGLDQEGIFRLAGQNVQCVKLREDFENGVISSFSPNENVHNVTSLLKQFLRDLSEPLFPFSQFDYIISLNELPPEECIEKLKEVLTTLPKENYHSIRQIFRLMFLVSLNSDLNRMDDSNITKVIAPNILYSNISQDQFASMTLVNSANDVLTHLVVHYPLVFENHFNLFEIDYLQDNPHADKILYRKSHGHSKSVVCLCISPDRNSIWSGDSKGTFRIWCAHSLTLIKSIDTGKKRINCITHCGGYIWLATPHSLQIRHQSTGEMVHEIEDITVINFAAIGDEIWVGDANVINCYAFEETAAKKTIRAKSIGTDFMSVNMAATGGNIWIACADRKIRVLQSLTLDVLAEFDSPQGRINSLDVVGNRIWTSADNCSVFVWDATTFELVAKLEGKHTGKVFGAAQVGNTCWTFAWNGVIHIYHAETFEYLGQVFQYHSDAIAGVASVFDEGLGCYRVYTASWDKSVILWHVKPSN